MWTSQVSVALGLLVYEYPNRIVGPLQRSLLHKRLVRNNVEMLDAHLSGK
jgi:hypothetical protein